MSNKAVLGFLSLTFITTALLMSAALYNHFPLLNGDTGSYIHNAYSPIFPKDRPIFYSWYIQFVSRERSLWYVVLSQCVLSALLICGYIYRFFKQIHFGVKTAIVVLIAAGTGICWFSGMLMPDIFTPLIFLTGILFIYSRNALIQVLLALLFFWFSVCHNAHLMLGFLFACAMIPVVHKTRDRSTLLRNTTMLLILNILGWFSVCESNRKAGYGFTPSVSSHIFIMGRMVENGVAKAYLDDHCPSATLKLCAYKNELPEHAWDFIWNDKGAFAHSGYWDSSKQEYQSIILGSLSQPKYWWLQLREAVKGSAIQLVQTSVGDAIPGSVDNSNTFYKIEEHYPQKLQYLRDSKQYRGELDFALLNKWYLAFTISVVLLFIGLLLRRPLPAMHRALLAATVIFLVLNALISCTFANILPRLSVRAAWLLPLVLLLISADTLKKFSGKQKETGGSSGAIERYSNGVPRLS